jgi:hypothetical protein
LSAPRSTARTSSSTPTAGSPARAVPGPDAGAAAEPVQVRGNAACPLALHELPLEVYEHEWNMLILDPQGVINLRRHPAGCWTPPRKGEGDTDVFLHDIDRKVEKAYAEEFLCDRFRVGSAGRCHNGRTRR